MRDEEMKEIMDDSRFLEASISISIQQMGGWEHHKGTPERNSYGKRNKELCIAHVKGWDVYDMSTMLGYTNL